MAAGFSAAKSCHCVLMKCDAKPIMRATPPDQESFAERFIVSVAFAFPVNMTVQTASPQPGVPRREYSETRCPCPPETIPSNKILGFGGDFIYAELTYAHAKMARRAVAQVLAARVAEGFCRSETEAALELGRRILYTTMLPHCSLRNRSTPPPPSNAFCAVAYLMGPSAFPPQRRVGLAACWRSRYET